MNPFTERREDQVACFGEKVLLSHIREWLGEASPAPPFGMGDDAAVLPEPGNLLCNDSLVFKQHFDRKTSPDKAGAKLLKRNLSDIAAMGGRPLHAVVALFMPPNLSLQWLERFTKGLAASALEYETLLVGGDVTETSDFLGATLSLTGYSSRPLTRHGSSVNDTLWVTGELGGSITGKHLTFQPRLVEGLFLSNFNRVHACIDLSDGLAKDLPELVPGSCSVIVDTSKVPLSRQAQNESRTSGQTPLQHALNDGEDYELLFTLDNTVTEEEFLHDWQTALPETPIACIGRITEAKDNRQFIDATTGEELLQGRGGYEHFS